MKTYTSKTTCSFCGKSFEFFCVGKSRTNLVDDKIPEVIEFGSNQACCNHIDNNGLADYSVNCPHCNREHHLSRNEVSDIPLEFRNA